MKTDSALGAIVLGGGRSRRLGRDKATVEVGGQSLLAHAVEAVAWAKPILIAATPMVVANAFPASIPPEVEQVLEDPPFGGPVAGIVAAVKRCDTRDLDRIVVLSCDVLGAKEAMAHLVTHSLTADGVCAVDAEGCPQYLLAIYRAEFLRRRCLEVGPARDLSVRKFFASANLLMIQMSRTRTQDIDTPDDLDWARKQYAVGGMEND